MPRRNPSGDTITEALIEPGVFTRNAYGQLTGVIERNEITVDDHTVDMAYDGGAIDIHNTGDIDMGAVAGYAGYGVHGLGGHLHPG